MGLLRAVRPSARAFAVAVVLAAVALVPISASALAPSPELPGWAGAPADPVADGARQAPGTVVVQFAEHATPADRARVLQELGARDVQELPWPGFFAVTVARGAAKEVVGRWGKSPLIESIEPNGRVFATGWIPDDPEFGRQWHLRNTGQVTAAGEGTPGADINVTRAWCITQGDPSVVVATLDTGVRFDHPDLVGRFFVNPGEIPGNGVDDDHNGKVDDVHGWDFEDHLVTGGDNDPSDTHGHGTLVAGIITAPADGEGTVGVAPGTTILPVRVLTDTNTSPPSGTHLQVALGIRYAVEMGARILNCSFGSTSFSTVVDAAVRDAREHQVMVVCGAGNSAENNDTLPFFPASYPYDNIISVTATDAADSLVQSFANYGRVSVDLAAPGVAIWGSIYRPSDPYDRFGAASGTSFSTPQVTGALALLEALVPGLEHPPPRQVLLAGVDSLSSLRWTTASAGRLNAHRMLVGVSEPDFTPPNRIEDLAVVEVGSYWIDLEWTAPGDDGADGEACCYELRMSGEPFGPDFEDAEEIVAPRPLPGGERQRFRVEGLDAETPYWFMIRTKDEALGESPPSNEVSGSTASATIVLTPPAVEFNATTGEDGWVEVRIHNPSSSATLDYDAAVDEQWMWVEPGQGSIAPGADATLLVWWSASRLPGSTYRGELTVASNAAGASLVRVPVTMVVRSASEIEVSPLSLDLGASWVGHVTEASVVVRNHGYQTLIVQDITSDHDDLSASPESFSLGPGAERNVLVSLSPQNPGPVATLLTVHSNDPFDAFVAVSVVANAVLPPVLDLSVSSVTTVGVTGSPTDPVPLRIRNLQVGGPDLELSLGAEETGVGTNPRPLSGSATPPWLALDPTSAVVRPGEEVEVLLHFSTSEIDPGLFTAAITIQSNDPARSEVELPVAFDVAGVAGLVLDAELGQFGETPVGTFAERTVPIANGGNDTLVVEPRLGGAFAIGPSTLRVAPGDTQLLHVRYRPDTPARDAALLRLFTNDPSRPAALLPVTGTGVAAPAWSGVIRLDRTFVVAEGDLLTIEPGTRVEMLEPLTPPRTATPAALPSLEVRGTLVVPGTREAPVQIGTNGDVTWEGVVVHGRVELQHAVVAGARAGLRVMPGGVLDVACTRIADNDIGLDYEGGAGAVARVSGTRLENREVNVRLATTDGLLMHGPGGPEPGRNELAVSAAPESTWNVDALASVVGSVPLEGNVWYAPDGTIWDETVLDRIQSTIRVASAADVVLLPLLASPPLPCDEEFIEPPLPDTPFAFAFARAVPNPVRSAILVDYDLPVGFLGLVEVDVFDVRGSRIRRLVGRPGSPGRHEARWGLDNDAGRRVSAGVYFLRFTTSEFTATRKIVILR